MMIFTWIAAHTDLIALAATILSVFVEVLRATGSLRQGLLALMLQAEKAAGNGELGGLTGPQIMDLVVRLALERVVPKLPPYIRILCTERNIRWFAEKVYAGARRYLQDGKLLPDVSTKRFA